MSRVAVFEGRGGTKFEGRRPALIYRADGHLGLSKEDFGLVARRDDRVARLTTLGVTLITPSLCQIPPSNNLLQNRLISINYRGRAHQAPRVSLPS